MSEKTAPQPESAPSPIGEISQEPSALEAFLDANQKKLIIIGILAILGLVGYVIFDGLNKMAARDAAGEVASARSVPELDTVSKAHEGTNAGGSALILKSQLLWRDQQQAEAIEAVESFISQYPEHPALGNAYASLGSYQQQLGNIEEAKKAFNRSVETESSASSLALLSLGDLALNTGNSEEAKAFYDRIITEYEDSHFQVKSMARDRIKLIGVQSPSEKTPEAPKALEPPKPTVSPSIPSDPVVSPGLPKPPESSPPSGPMNLPELELPKEITPPVKPETAKPVDSSNPE